jgi:hypothetical protein
MGKPYQRIGFCYVLIIASATIGGCFPFNKQVNVVLPNDIYGIHFNIFG